VKIAVVIPALDEADRIGPAILSALAPGVDVLVVDGGSRDRTWEAAREAGARVIDSSPGRARQLQAGVEASASEAVVLLHADTLLPAGWSDAVRAALAEPAVVGGAFSFAFAAPPQPSSPWIRARLRFVAWGVRLRLRFWQLPYGDQALFARRASLAEVGGVPQVAMMEDLDLVAALRARGQLRILPEAVATSPRRYLSGGVLRTMLRNWVALSAWRLGVSRDAVARWYAR